MHNTRTNNEICVMVEFGHVLAGKGTLTIQTSFFLDIFKITCRVWCKKYNKNKVKMPRTGNKKKEKSDQ